MVYMDFPVKIYKILRYGWTLETDPVTGLYVYGSVPRTMLDSYELCKFYLRQAPKLCTSMGARIKRAYRKFSKRFPTTNLVMTATAAAVVYFVGVGIAWSVSFKVLRYLRIF